MEIIKLKTNNINKISFGTGVNINYVTAITELPKYNVNIAKGAFDAFDKLCGNGISDKIVVQLGKNKKISEDDILKIDYYPARFGAKSHNIQNSVFITLKELSDRTTEEISKLIVGLYEKVKKAQYQDYTSEKLQRSNGMIPTITEEHKIKIQELIDCFGSSD